MRFSSANTTTTWDVSTDTFLLSVTRDEGMWLVTDRETDVYGYGRSLLEAMCDYWAALFSHIAVLEDKPLVSHLERQLAAMRRRTEVHNQEHAPASRQDG